MREQKMTVIHVLYSGNSRGGAQQFSLQFAGLTKCKTMSVRPGDFEKKIQAAGFDFVELSYLNKHARSSYYLIASDPRAFIKLLCSGVRPDMLILHSNNWLRPLRFAILFTLLSVVPTRLVVTTPRQFNKFCSFVPSRISPIMKLAIEPLKRENARNMGFIYFGRFSREKRINDLIQQWIKSGVYDEFGARLTLVGEKYPYLKKEQMQKYNIYLIDQWLDKPSLNKIIKEHDVVVNNCLQEGLSIQLVEGVFSGLVPLVASVDLQTLYFGHPSKNGTLRDGFHEYCKLSKYELDTMHERVITSLESYFTDYRTDYEVFINEFR